MFIFGAGASHGARNPAPPLGKDLHRYVLRYLSEGWKELFDLEDGDGTVIEQARQDLKGRLQRTLSFEALVNKLRAEDNKYLLEKLNFLMACALTPPVHDDPRANDAFVEKRDVYDDFLVAHFPSSGDLNDVSFITLNYDCLLERAICRHLSHKPEQGEQQCLCKRVNYHLPGCSSGIEVLKPHGSINWVADILLGDGTLREGEPIPQVADIKDGLWEWKEIHAVDLPNEHGHQEILVAHYGPEKEAQINPGVLGRIRKVALDRIQAADSVTIIGVHLPADPKEDPFLYEALQTMRKHGSHRVVYVSRDDREIERARSEWSFRVERLWFAEYVTNH